MAHVEGSGTALAMPIALVVAVRHNHHMIGDFEDRLFLGSLASSLRSRTMMRSARTRAVAVHAVEIADIAAPIRRAATATPEHRSHAAL